MPPATDSRSYRRLFAVEGFPRLVASMLLARTAAQMVALVLVLFALGRYASPELAGIATFLSIAPGIAVTPVAGALLDRHGRTRLIMLFATELATVALGMLVLGVATGPFDIVLFTLRQRRTDPAWLGRAFAVSMYLNYAGFPVGSALGGFLAGASVAGALATAIAIGVFTTLITPLVIPRR